MTARGRSVFQLFDPIRLKHNQVLNNYKCTAKSHSTMDKKYLRTIYAEHSKFLIERCSWSVKKIHKHITFRQEMFKNEFLIKNQVARRNAKTPMGKKITD